MKVLITGGAGYIGSHMALELLDQDNEVVILDNLTSGSKNIIPPKATFIEGDISDLNLLVKTYRLLIFRKKFLNKKSLKRLLLNFYF